MAVRKPRAGLGSQLTGVLLALPPHSLPYMSPCHTCLQGPGLAMAATSASLDQDQGLAKPLASCPKVLPAAACPSYLWSLCMSLVDWLAGVGRLFPG